MNPFRPLPLTAGPHRQTLIGYWVRYSLGWKHPTEDVVVDAPEDARLLLRVTWQEGRREERPALLLVHGLEGTDASSYMLSAAELALREGWHVIRMNLRGCGDSEAICPRLYNAGLATDLLAALEWTSANVPRFAVCGFSLGGNLVLITLARHRAAIPAGLRAVVAVSPPLDLATCADTLARPQNFLYRAYFLRKLRASYRRRRKRAPDLYSAELDRPYTSLREFDDVITAPYGGYSSAADYYARASAGPRLSEVDRPSLILAAADDPLIPEEAVARWSTGDFVMREITRTGGHVGFFGRSAAPRYFWAAERALEFVRREIAN